MKLQPFLVILTVLNLCLTVFLLAQLRGREAFAAAAQTGGAPQAAPVLRGSALEIVDDQGRIRASIQLHPANPNYKWPDGRIGYPETIMLRLADANGRPEVKLGASVNGAGLGLLGDTDSTQITLKAEGADTSLRLTSKDGRQHVIKP